MNLWKQRVTLMLTMLFCMIVAGTEYLPHHEQEKSPVSKEQSNKADQSPDNQTFLNIAIDAVVPFVTVLSQQVFYLIYENLVFEKPTVSELGVAFPVNLPYWEILLERIISPNAP
ncbi:hypothetical protein [Aquiflexum lacus]|uniref:hypothetical protein n=1 Tax=Aquiflexum lacus TaxID=2483805 RepID=UPI001E62763E|nr:hypothetical protein [Aquiflexum lacus]